MELGKYGVFFFTEGMNKDQLIEYGQKTEALGYSVLWYPEAMGNEAMALGSFMLSHTDKLILASGIANIYARDATATVQGQHTLSRLSDGRFLLGLGVSHAPMVEDARGHVYGKPVATMRAYLDAMEKAPNMTPAPEGATPTVLAALGPKMTELAAERTDGIYPYNITPEHTEKARAIVGPGKWVCSEQKVLLCDDPVKARAAARKNLEIYLGLPNYCNNWLRLGFTEEDLSNGGSDRFIDSIVAWGDEGVIRDRIEAHLQAGADHVCLQPVNPSGKPVLDWAVLEAMAPSSS